MCIITTLGVGYYLSSSVNPLLYSLLSKRFRRGFLDMLPCLWRLSRFRTPEQQPQAPQQQQPQQQQAQQASRSSNNNIGSGSGNKATGASAAAGRRQLSFKRTVLARYVK